VIGTEAVMLPEPLESLSSSELPELLLPLPLPLPDEDEPELLLSLSSFCEMTNCHRTS